MRNNYADKDAEAYFFDVEKDNQDAAVLTVAGDQDQFWVIDWVSISTRSGDHLQVSFGGDIKYKAEFGSADFHHIEFTRPLYGEKGEEMIVTLSGTGSGKRHLNVRYR